MTWALAGIALISGCATSPTASLEQARSEYQQASQDPQITQHAPVPLRSAEQSLSEAERALSQSGNEKVVEHYAYLTEQRVEIARARAQEALASQQIDELARQREQVVLEARTQETQQLQQELRDLRARQTDRGVEITLGNVLFEFNRAELKPGAERNLQPLVDYLRSNPQRDLLIEGHTDSVGSEQYNQELSRERAAAVQRFLTRQGISRDRLTIRGYGEQYPVASNNTDAGRQQNRRVDVVILNEGQSASQVAR
ncbi:MAG: OmpA family protein [Thiogranum sp.]|nr:OmpA family protein [Thiogranum sp.]